MTILGVTASSIAKANASFDSIATASGTGSSSQITFSSIPNTYRHLQLRIYSRLDGPGPNVTDLELRINGDTGTFYGTHMGRGMSDGTALATTYLANTTNRFLLLYAGTITPNSGAEGFALIDIHNYASTTSKKVIRFQYTNGFEATNGLYGVFYGSGLYNISNTAVSSILIQSGGGQYFTTTTRIDLYGIKG